MARPSQGIDQALLRSGLALLPELGCTGLSVRRVAEHAGVNPAMFHYHFGSKAAFLRAVLQQLYEQMFAGLSAQAAGRGTALERLHAALFSLAGFVRAQRPVIGRLAVDAANGETVVHEFVRANAPRHLGLLLALGQGGVPQNLAESERWANAAKLTAASVGRYCVTPPMIAAYRELLEALKNDPGLRMLNLFGGGITGMQFEEGTFRIEGAGAEAVTTPDGPFLCRVVGRNEGGSVRNVKPEYAYAGEDEQGRSLYVDQRGDVMMNEAIASMVNAMSGQVQASAAFAVKPLGGNRFRVRIVQEQINTGNVYATEVQIGPEMLAMVQPAPASSQAPAGTARPPAPGLAPSPAPSATPVAAVAPATARPAQGNRPAQTAQNEDPARERSVWSLCQSATTATMCQAYLQDYPNGVYAAQAQRRAAELSRGTAQPAAAPAAGGAAPTDSTLDRLVDGGFLRWGQRWAVDRYIGGSAALTQRECGADRCQVRGMFRFARFAAVLSIPYMALLQRRDSGDFALARLCYADPSSGRQECMDW